MNKSNGILLLITKHIQCKLLLCKTTNRNRIISENRQNIVYFINCVSISSLESTIIYYTNCIRIKTKPICNESSQIIYNNYRLSIQLYQLEIIC